MMEPVRVVNYMREFRLNTCIDLDAVHRLLPESKLYRGRPQMLVVKMSCGHNLQMFPKGCVQIMGNISYTTALLMSHDIMQHLEKLYPHLESTPLTLKNLVVSARLKTDVSLHRVKRSSSTMCYEPELFPAILMRRFRPAHIAVFHTGRCIITGVHSVEQGQRIVHKLNAYLTKKKLFLD